MGSHDQLGAEATAVTGPRPAAALPVAAVAPVPPVSGNTDEPARESGDGQVLLAAIGQRIAPDPDRLMAFAERQLALGISPRATGRLVRQIKRPSIGPLVVMTVGVVVLALSSVAIAMITRSAWSALPLAGAGLTSGILAYRRRDRGGPSN